MPEILETNRPLMEDETREATVMGFESQQECIAPT